MAAAKVGACFVTLIGGCGIWTAYKQVRSNKDASEGRDEEKNCRKRLARFDCRLFTADSLQVYNSLFTG